MSFRFETILRLNKKKEDLLQRGMGEINIHYQRQKDQQQFVQDATAASKDELNQKKRLGVSVETMILYDNFARGTQTHIEKQNEIISDTWYY